MISVACRACFRGWWATGDPADERCSVCEKTPVVTGRVLELPLRGCAFGDPTCPCQDGDACHYVDFPGSPAMRPPKTLVAPWADDPQFAGRPGSAL